MGSGQAEATGKLLAGGYGRCERVPARRTTYMGRQPPDLSLKPRQRRALGSQRGGTSATGTRPGGGRDERVEILGAVEIEGLQSF